MSLNKKQRNENIWRNSECALVRVFYRNKNKGITQNKELMHVITETDKSLDLLLASWRPRRAGGVGLIRMPTDSRLRKSQCFSSSLKVEKKKRSPSSKAVMQKEFPLIQERLHIFDLFRPSTDWVRPTYIREGNLLYPIYYTAQSC